MIAGILPVVAPTTAETSHQRAPDSTAAAKASIASIHGEASGDFISVRVSWTSSLGDEAQTKQDRDEENSLHCFRDWVGKVDENFSFSFQFFFTYNV